MIRSNLFVLAFVLPALVIGQTTFGLYSMTLDVPNMLTIFSGSANGAITYVKQIPTGGDGPSSEEPGIQSQNSITVLGNYLFAVNTGSNTVSMFEIDPYDPTNVTLVGSPVSSGGDWPNSVTAHGNNVCVVNSGEDNGLRCFTFGSSGLTAVTSSDRDFDLSLSTPPVSHVGPAQISFTPDGSGLIISLKGLNPPVLLYPFSSGAVAEDYVESADNGMVNFGFTFDSDGTVVLTDAAPYGNGSGIIYLSYTTSGSGNISFTTPNYHLIPNEIAACWVTRSNATSRFYVANAGSSAITEISRSGNTMTVENEYFLGNATAPSDVRVVSIGGTDYLFVNEGGAMAIACFKLVPGGTAVSCGTPVSSHQGAHGAGLAYYVGTTSTTGQPSSPASVITILPLLSLLMMFIL